MKAIIENSKIIKTIYNEKYMTIVFAVLFVLSLLPLFVIAFYNYPGVDDFNHGIRTGVVYRDTHNVAAVLLVAFEYFGDMYNTWQGRFSDTFLTAINPVVFSETLYPVTAFIMLVMLMGSTAFFLHTILVRVLGLAGKYVVLVGVPILFFSLQSLPSPVEGFYWFSGAIAYTFFYSLMLFLLSVGLRLYNSPPWRVPLAARRHHSG